MFHNAGSNIFYCGSMNMPIGFDPSWEGSLDQIFQIRFCFFGTSKMAFVMDSLRRFLLNNMQQCDGRVQFLGERCCGRQCRFSEMRTIERNENILEHVLCTYSNLIEKENVESHDQPG